jgi:hypothetical protein
MKLGTEREGGGVFESRAVYHGEGFESIALTGDDLSMYDRGIITREMLSRGGSGEKMAVLW